MTAAHPRAEIEEDADGAERRRHRRVPVALRARFLASDDTEHDCTVVNISAGGLRLAAERPVPVNSRIVLYVDQVGRFDCTVVRHTSGGFAVRFDIHAKKRERTVEALSRLLIEGPRGADQRREFRVEADAKACLTLENGDARECRIIDISLTGAAVEVADPPAVGETVRLGRMRATVVRRSESGVGLSFHGGASTAALDNVMKSTDGR